jgi:hypothetical protein
METIMRKSYMMYAGNRSFWPYLLIALGLILFVGKAFIFPLLIFAGIWWMFSRGVCGMRWHHHDWHNEMRQKSKRKNDENWDEDDDYIIV